MSHLRMMWKTLLYTLSNYGITSGSTTQVPQNVPQKQQLQSQWHIHISRAYPSQSSDYFSKCVRCCMPVVSTLSWCIGNSSLTLRFSSSSTAKRRPRSTSFRGPRRWSSKGGGGYQIRLWGRWWSWFIFLSGQTLQIRCFNFFNVCTCRSELWRLSRGIPLAVGFTAQKTLAMISPAEVCTFNLLSTILSYRPDLAPSDFHFLGPTGRMHSEDAVWRTRTSWNTASRKSSDTAVESRQRLTQRWKNCVDNEGDFVEKSPESIRQICPHHSLKSSF